MKTKPSPSKNLPLWIGFWASYKVSHNLPGPKPAPPALSLIKFEPHMLAPLLNPQAGSSIHQKRWIFLLNPITGFKALTGTGMITENLDSQFHHKICYRTPKEWIFLSFDTWYVWNWGRPSRFSSSAVHAFSMKGYVSLMWDRISRLTLENKRVPDSPKNVEWFLSRLPQD